LLRHLAGHRPADPRVQPLPESLPLGLRQRSDPLLGEPVRRGRADGPRDRPRGHDRRARRARRDPPGLVAARGSRDRARGRARRGARRDRARPRGRLPGRERQHQHRRAPQRADALRDLALRRSVDDAVRERDGALWEPRLVLPFPHDRRGGDRVIRRPLAIALVLALATACAPTPVEVNLTFPSRDTFLYADFGRLLIYEVELEASADGCPALLERLSTGGIGTPVYDSDWAPICDFRSGAIQFGDIPPGPHAYAALARDNANNLLLTGCTVAEAYEGAPRVPVRLFPTTTYEEMTRGRTLSCTTEDDKCAGGC